MRGRIQRDRDNPNIRHDEVTVIDRALTRPWTADKRYVRDPNDVRRKWTEPNCNATNQFVTIGKEMYYHSADGYPVPMKRCPTPPDLRYFNRRQK